MPPYLLQYNLVITLTTLPQLPSVEFFKSRLISQLTVRLGLTNSHHMSSLRTNKTSGVPGQLSSASNWNFTQNKMQDCIRHTDDWDCRPSDCGQDGLREDIKIRRFGGVLSSIVKDCIGNHSLHTLLYRVTTKYFLNEKDQSICLCFVYSSWWRLRDWFLIRQNLFLHCCLILNLIHHFCQSFSRQVRTLGQCD